MKMPHLRKAFDLKDRDGRHVFDQGQCLQIVVDDR